MMTQKRNFSHRLILSLFFGVILFFGSRSYIHAQTDTSFWFVAPDVLAAAGDAPIRFKLTSQGQASQVTIAMPANPSFTPIQFTIPANGFFLQEMTPFLNQIENSPINTINNKGILISASTPVTVYYENVGNNCASCKNADIISLKGKNALGLEFYLPFQNVIPNTNGGRSGFEIVATEDSTQVTVQLTRAATGKAVGTHTFLLNRGQTYSIQAEVTTADGHMSGSRVSANKPIAISLKDDQISGGSFWGSNCRDLLTDQLIPTNFIGRSYILQNSGNMSGNRDLIVLTATTNNTIIEANGTTQIANLQAGETFVYEFTAARTYLSSNHPIYVVHITGYNCAAGMALIPPLECTGSYQVGVSRTQNQDFILNLITRAGNEGNFTFLNNNGNSFTILASSFQDVPGTNGNWKSRSFSLTNSQLPNNGNILIRNSSGLFHAGFINGNAAHGSKYGYFSDFSSYLINAVLLNGGNNLLCPGTDVTLSVDSIVFATYQWTGPNGFSSNLRSPTITNFSPSDTGYYYIKATVEGCESNLDSIYLGINALLTPPNQTNNGPLCTGDTLQLQADSIPGAIYHWVGPNSFTSNLRNPLLAAITPSQSGTYALTISLNGCISDTFVTQVIVNDYPARPQIQPINNPICAGSTIILVANAAAGSQVRWVSPHGLNTVADTLYIPAFSVADTGRYLAYAENGNCSSLPDSLQLILAPSVVLPNLQQSGTTACIGDSIRLYFQPQSGHNYQWLLNNSPIPSATDTSIYARQSGRYRVISTNQSNCTDTSLALTIGFSGPADLPIQSSNNPPTLCPGDSLQLSYPLVSGYVYNWFRNGISLGLSQHQITVNQAGLYSLTITDSAGCTRQLTDTLEVVVNLLPNISILPADTILLCNSASTLLTATSDPLASYQWFRNGLPIAGATDSTYLANLSGNYFVVAGYGNACTDTSNTSILIQDAPPSVTVNQLTDTLVCQGDSLVVFASSNAAVQYQWLRNGQAFGSLNDSTQTLYFAGLYQLLVTTANGCHDTVASFRLDIPSFTAPILQPSGQTSFCSGDSALITRTNPQNGTYQWLINGNSVASIDTFIYVATTSVVGLQYTYPEGCVLFADSIVATENPLPNPNIVSLSGTSACFGDTISLHLTNNNLWQLQWHFNGNVLAGIQSDTLHASQSGVYYLVATNTVGCSDTSQQLNLSFNTIATPSLLTPGPIELCEGDSIVLRTTAWPGAYQWYRNGALINGATDSNLTTFLSGNYHFTYTDSNACVGFSDTVIVNLNNRPSAQILPSDSTDFCQGNEITLFAQPAGNHTYAWTRNGIVVPGATNSFLDVSDSASYAVIVSNSQGCSDTSASIETTVIPRPVAAIQQLVTNALCDGDSVMLTASGGTTYTWLRNDTLINGASQAQLWVSTSGTYSVVVANGAGCTDTAQIGPLSFSARPTAQLNLNTPQQACEGDTIHLLATDTVGLSFQWLRNGMSLTNDTLRNLVVTISGGYQLVVRNAAGCSDTSAPLLVSFDTLPPATISPNPVVAICQGDSVLLQGPVGNFTYQWLRNGLPLPGAHAANLQTAVGGAHRLIVTNAAGCSDTSDITTVFVSLPPNPQIGINGSDTICAGDSTHLQINNPIPGLSYDWLLNGNPIQTGGTQLTVLAAGVYQVIASDTTGCNGPSNLLTVHVNPIPSAVLNQNAPITSCIGDTILLEIFTSPGNTFQWLINGNIIPGANQSTYAVTSSGTYSCEVTNSLGCPNYSNGVFVQFNQLPNASLGSSNGPICEGDQVALNATSISGVNYEWTGPRGFFSSLQNPTIPGARANQSGWYLLRTELNGCYSPYDSVFVEIEPPLPPISIQGRRRLCTGYDLNFDPIDIPGARYVWYLPSGDSVVSRRLQRQQLWLSDSGEYRLRVSRGSCISDEIVVAASVRDHGMFFPTAFTPNGDGINDDFHPITLYEGEFDLRVFDRWGRRIFWTQNPQDRWDGRINGEYAEPGAYSYVVTFEGCIGGTEVQYGTVFLLR